MKNKKTNFFGIIAYEIKFCFQHSPVLMIVESLACVLHGFSFVAVTYMTQAFFDTIANVLSGNQIVNQAYIATVFLGLIIIFNQLINGIENFTLEVLNNKLLGYSKVQLYLKSSRLNAEFFESPQLLDLLNKAVEGAEYITIPLFPIIGVMTFYVSYFVGMGIYIFNLQPVLVVSLLMVFIPSIASQYLKIALYSNLANQAAPYRRKFQHYEDCICGRQFLKETRALMGIGYFMKLYKEVLKLLSKKMDKANLKSTSIELKAKLITLTGYFFIVLLLVVNLLNNSISAGAFAAVYMSVGKLFSMMGEAVDVAGNAIRNLGLVRNYLEFLEYPEGEINDGNIYLKECIEIENVSYHYPGAKADALSGIYLKLDAGENIAIVGKNGSGKTTLVRIICGLFMPSSGKVMYDKKDIKTASLRSIYKNISAVFQNYQRYQMTLRQNISIGGIDESKDADACELRIYDILKKVDLKVDKNMFKNGLDTMLSREFGGTELSGGQWQRIAIGRGLFKKNHLIVLDEPTAAIDPFEESKLYHTFSEISKDNTSIIVTHRLGVAKIADRIIVMDGGRIVESGTHSELIEADGIYKEMFESQAKWYQVIN